MNNTGIIYSAFGAELMNAKGEITVEFEAVSQVLDTHANWSGSFPQTP